MFCTNEQTVAQRAIAIIPQCKICRLLQKRFAGENLEAHQNGRATSSSKDGLPGQPFLVLSNVYLLNAALTNVGSMLGSAGQIKVEKVAGVTLLSAAWLIQRCTTAGFHRVGCGSWPSFASSSAVHKLWTAKNL